MKPIRTDRAGNISGLPESLFHLDSLCNILKTRPDLSKIEYGRLDAASDCLKRQIAKINRQALS